MSSRNNFATLLLMLSCLLNYTSADLADERIVNGRPDNITNSPYAVALLNSGTFYCTGSLVSMKLVITAAHCVEPFQANNINIVAGVTDIRQVGQRRRVERMFSSNQYNPDTLEMDIAAIIVRTPFNAGPTVAAIPLCSTPMPAGTQIRFSGWGQTGENEPSVDELRTASVTVVRHQYCVNAYKNAGVTITNTMICAGRGVRDTCSGDSGGPGVVNRQLCAVVSFAIGCARKGFPGVSVNVNNQKVRSFITNAMNQ